MSRLSLYNVHLAYRAAMPACLFTYKTTTQRYCTVCSAAYIKLALIGRPFVLKEECWGGGGTCSPRTFPFPFFLTQRAECTSVYMEMDVHPIERGLGMYNSTSAYAMSYCKLLSAISRCSSRCSSCLFNP